MASERQQQTVSDAVGIVLLGDALANDGDLRSALPELNAAIANDATGSSGWSTLELLRRVWSECVSSNYGRIRTAVSWAVECFTQAESKRIIATSEAKVNNAKANKINAQAAAIRASERRRDELLEYFRSRSIDMAADQQEGILRVVFKKPDADE